MSRIKKLSLISFIILSCFLFFVMIKQKNPEITSVIMLSNITKEEFEQIKDLSKTESENINDFKKLLIDVKIINSKKATERTIIIPDLFIVDKYDRVRVIDGRTTYHNIIGIENSAESIAYIIFDNRGLNENDIINIYKESKIYIYYKLPKSELEEKLSIGNNITFHD